MTSYSKKQKQALRKPGQHVSNWTGLLYRFSTLVMVESWRLVSSGASAFLKGMEAFKLASRHRSSLSATVTSTNRCFHLPTAHVPFRQTGLRPLECEWKSMAMAWLRKQRMRHLGRVLRIHDAAAAPVSERNQLSLGPKRVIAPAAPTLPEHEPPRCMSAYERWV